MEIDILSLYFIERYWRREQFGQLLKGLSQNGLWLPDRLAALLGQSQVGAVSLGLKRVLEMSYGLTLLGREMANQLVDGWFNSDPLVTGMASSSLDMALGEQAPEDQWAQQGVAACVDRTRSCGCGIGLHAGGRRVVCRR